MTTYYLAVTYDVCPHLDVYEAMGEYMLDDLQNIHETVREFAKQDVASVVKVFNSSTPDFENSVVIQELSFPEYACHCE